MKTLNNYINEALIKKDTVLDLKENVLLWAAGECWHILKQKFDEAGYKKIYLKYALYIVPYNVGVDTVKEINGKTNGHVYIYNIPKDFSIDDVQNMDKYEQNKLGDKILNSDNRIKI